MLEFRPVFAEGEAISWDKRDVVMKSAEGVETFRQDNVHFPTTWSDQARQIVTSKYFYGDIAKGLNPEAGGREHSLQQLVMRVVNTITRFGVARAYFDEENAKVFREELSWLLYNQYGSFNSPVWFNVGLFQEYGLTEEDQKNWTYGVFFKEDGSVYIDRTDPYARPQASACFIISVEDNMSSILQSYSDSGMLFKYGSGVGADWSKLRSTKDRLSGGGRPSGPLSFMSVQDKVGGVIKSGGKTRRAAIMQTLRDWHPDILQFVHAKKDEERKAQALIDAGYDGSFNGDAYGTVLFQNVNQSVRVTDHFMEKVKRNIELVEEGAEKFRDTYRLVSPANKDDVIENIFPEELLREIAESTYFCGDPGVQYEDTIQRWHTCKATGPINSSNPCSEYMFLDNSACNLASLNLVKFIKRNMTTGEYEFDIERFREAVRIFLIAQDILVTLASYPSEEIARNSEDFRPLGLGFANLGALIMAIGLPYDSEKSRDLAGSITALMQGTCCRVSAEMASVVGPFNRYEENKDSFKEVMDLHLNTAFEQDARNLDYAINGAFIWQAVAEDFEQGIALGDEHGWRNSQFTVLAPTGTIAFMMDCDTTGIEPETALVKYKLLAGEGETMMKIVNGTVESGLISLGYKGSEVYDILKYIEENDTIEGAPYLRPEEYNVFDCSLKPAKGTRSIEWRAHLEMMAACQPFLSGAISKTINMPEGATVEDIMQAYILGWKLGLKAVAIYRENSKRSQPLSTSLSKNPEGGGEILPQLRLAEPIRKKLPEERPSITHKQTISGHDLYITVGMYPDNGMPGEIFIRIAKQGSTLSGLLDVLATQISLGLQYGVPIEKICEHLQGTKFEPNGYVGSEHIKFAHSITDYLGRWLDYRFLSKERVEDLERKFGLVSEQVPAPAPQPKLIGDLCPSCGTPSLVQTGSCKTCSSCGYNEGGCG